MKELTRVRLKKETEGIPEGEYGVISFVYTEGVYDVKFTSRSLILTKEEIDELD